MNSIMERWVQTCRHELGRNVSEQEAKVAIRATNGLRGARPSRAAVRVGPPPPDQVGVPAQHGPGRDDQAHPAKMTSGQQPGQGCQDRPIGPRQPRGLDLALKHGALVTQDQDLGVLGPVRPGEQGQPAEDAQHRKVSESY